MDVDGVLVDGRPEDGRHWQTSIEEDLGFSAATLHEQFFAPYWEDILLGRAGLMERLTTAFQNIAPQVTPTTFLSYWFEMDSRLVAAFLPELALVRSNGILVYLATNQEHLRAAYLMEALGLAEHVDGIFYSARIGAKKPDIEFFAKVQAATALRGDEMLLIDDSLQNIEAAFRAGWQAVHWTKDSAPNILRSFVHDLPHDGDRRTTEARSTHHSHCSPIERRLVTSLPAFDVESISRYAASLPGTNESDRSASYLVVPTVEEQMFVPLWLGVPALVLVLLLVAWCALILAGRNPLPFPDVGSRIFSAASPAAKATIVELLAQHGVRERFQADSGGVLRTIMWDGTIINYPDPAVCTATRLGRCEHRLVVDDPAAAAHAAATFLTARGFSAEVVLDWSRGCPLRSSCRTSSRAQSSTSAST